MDIRECTERFITSQWKKMEIPTDNPESSRVILWKYLKKRRERLKEFNERISISKKEKSIVLKKYKERPEEAIVTLENGDEVLLKDLINP